jgi:hypothetical protein
MLASSECDYDVVVIGAGPAGCSLAALLAAAKNPPKVALLSSKADQRWIPNYGCWTEEWAQLDALYAARGVPGLMVKGVDVQWSDTDCFFGEDADGKLDSEPEGNARRTLGRAYLRVSRAGLKRLLYGDDSSRAYDVIKEDVLGAVVGTNVFAPYGSVSLYPTYTELTLAASQRKLKARIVVDATGAESRFTIRDDRDKEGYQIAYGLECKVAGAGVTDTHVGDYARSKMTLFDYRSEVWRTTNGLSESKVRAIGGGGGGGCGGGARGQCLLVCVLFCPVSFSWLACTWSGDQGADFQLRDAAAPRRYIL